MCGISVTYSVCLRVSSVLEVMVRVHSERRITEIKNGLSSVNGKVHAAEIGDEAYGTAVDSDSSRKAQAYGERASASLLDSALLPARKYRHTNIQIHLSSVTLSYTNIPNKV